MSQVLPRVNLKGECIKMRRFFLVCPIVVHPFVAFLLAIVFYINNLCLWHVLCFILFMLFL